MRLDCGAWPRVPGRCSMKAKHLAIRIEQCLAIAKASNCVRKRPDGGTGYGALLLDPERNVILMDGYNGGARGGAPLCGGEECWRDKFRIPSGQSFEIGCIHAEMNVICNAAASGVRTKGAWLIVNGEPCLMCARHLHQAGIKKVIVVQGGYGSTDGVDFLRSHGVEVQPVSWP